LPDPAPSYIAVPTVKGFESTAEMLFPVLYPNRRSVFPPAVFVGDWIEIVRGRVPPRVPLQSLPFPPCPTAGY